MSEQRRCREAQGMRRKLGCYASHTASAFKQKAVRVTRWHGGEEQKHPWGYFLLGLLVVGVIFYAGGSLLAYTYEFKNPTVLDATLAQKTVWKDASGSILADGSTVRGIITVAVTMPVVQLAELATATIYTKTGNILVPYYVRAVEEYVYASDGTFRLSFPLTPSHASYATDMNNWLGAWGSSIATSLITYGDWSRVVAPDATYTTGETWSGSLDTRGLPNAAYRIFTCITWAPVLSAGSIPIIPSVLNLGTLTPITTPEPPSLSGASWHNIGAVWLSSLLLGEEGSEPTGPQVTIASNATSGNPPLAVKFNSTVTPGTDGSTDFAYLWDFGDGQTSIMAQPEVHIFNATGYYSVKLTVTDALGGSVTKTITITVGTPPTPDAGLIVAAFILFSLIAVAIVLFAKRR